MLSIRDCLDYCDLTEDEVSLIAEHENVCDAAAAQIACGLVQTPEGVVLLTSFMEDLIDKATRAGHQDKADYARQICARFRADHPTRH